MPPGARHAPIVDARGAASASPGTARVWPKPPTSANTTPRRSTTPPTRTPSTAALRRTASRPGMRVALRHQRCQRRRGLPRERTPRTPPANARTSASVSNLQRRAGHIRRRAPAASPSRAAAPAIVPAAGSRRSRRRSAARSRPRPAADSNGRLVSPTSASRSEIDVIVRSVILLRKFLLEVRRERGEFAAARSTVECPVAAGRRRRSILLCARPALRPGHAAGHDQVGRAMRREMKSRRRNTDHEPPRGADLDRSGEDASDPIRAGSATSRS